MSIATQPFIIYTLPASRTTQALKRRKTDKAWDDIERFLTTCTDADPEATCSIELQGYTANLELGELPEPAERLIKQATEIFGAGTTKPIGYHYPSREPHSQNKTTWRLQSGDLCRALDFMTGLQLPPKYNMGHWNCS